MQNVAELNWLLAIALITALMWLPHILELMLRRGLGAALANPAPDADTPAWANRAKRAHMNGVENLAIFAPVVIVAAMVGATGGGVLLAVKLYVLSRLAHYIIYVAGIPVARTLTFAIGLAATIFIAYSAYGAMG